MWAVNEGHTAATQLLIESGANINARSKGTSSPIVFAVRGGKADIVRLLLKAGANANDTVAGAAVSTGVAGPTTDSTSLVGLAIINGQYDTARLLLENGADPNAADSRGSLLHTLAWMRRPGSGGRGLLPDPVGDSLALAKALLARGANPNVRISWEEIPFDRDDGEAKSPPNVPVGRDYIIMSGATPYFLAAKNGDPALMRLLVAHGANARLPNVQGVTPFMAAAGLGYWDGESSGPLNGTPEAERLEAVKLALDLSGDAVNATADFGGNIAFNEDGEDLLFAYPLDYSADPTLGPRPEAAMGDVRWAGSTALHGAATLGQPSIIRFLVEKGARLDARNTLGWTPLMVTQGDPDRGERQVLSADRGADQAVDDGTRNGPGEIQPAPRPQVALTQGAWRAVKARLTHVTFGISEAAAITRPLPPGECSDSRGTSSSDRTCS